MLEIVRRCAPLKQANTSNTGRDTIAMVVCDGDVISIATSTSGWPGKYPGRVGDSPIAGAGFYADSRFGASFCTHTGEITMRAGTTRYVVAQLEAGRSVHDAVDKAIDDVSKLQNGHIGELVVYAIDSQGRVRVVALNAEGAIGYWYWSEMLDKPQYCTAESITVDALRKE